MPDRLAELSAIDRAVQALRKERGRLMSEVAAIDKAINAIDAVNQRPAVNLLRCHGDSDGECSWEHCPQIRDNEPKASGRHCPIDVREDFA